MTMEPMHIEHIGIAVKDWSTLTASSVEMRDTAVCLSLYRKKQEFGAPRATRVILPLTVTAMLSCVAMYCTWFGFT